MTWQEFVDSAWNNTEYDAVFSVNGTRVYCRSRVIHNDSAYMSPDDVISSDENYSTDPF